MAAVRYDFCMSQGMKHTFKLDKKDGFGNPKSLVNYLGKIKIKKRKSDADVICEHPITFLDAPNGKMEVVIPETAFNNVIIKNATNDYKDNHVYELYLYKLSGTVETDIDILLNGHIQLTARV